MKQLQKEVPMDKNLTILEKVMLMGLLPLLGATNNLKQALITAISAVLISLLIKFFARFISEREDYHWYLLIGVGITLSYVFYIAVIDLFPELEIYVNNYLLLLGVTPLIYIGASRSENKFFAYQKDFFILMVFVGALREVLGKGSIFSIQLTAAGYPPLGFVKDFPGAFLVVSIIYLLVELTRRDKKSLREGSEKIV
jgi:Na+-translocating ferredoxin:NAD+ oxidoreductase RnfE subunit